MDRREQLVCAGNEMVRRGLHIHTTASDGRWLPAQVVEQVRRTGLDLFAVTDHDAVDSLHPVENLVRGSGPAFIPGVGISSTPEGCSCHLLGRGRPYSTDSSSAESMASSATRRITIAR
jgi:predicted metal-dependent phosphoesterase TrpH